MGFFSHESHRDVYGSDGDGGNQAKFSHELIGGAAAFEAMRMYEKRQEAEGRPENHAFAKELLAGFAGAEVDKLFETKGLDYLDRERARRHAQQEAVAQYENQYQGGYQGGGYQGGGYQGGGYQGGGYQGGQYQGGGYQGGGY